MKHLLKFIAVIAVCNFFTVSPALAVGSSGFENAAYSSRSLAKGNAVTADPDEPSTVAFNPAGLTELDGIQTNTSIMMIVPITSYESAVGDSNDGTSTPFAVVPTFYLSVQTPIEGLYLGAGSNSPFGLLTQYSSTGPFKYNANFNELKTANYYLSGAYRLTSSFSIGGGWNYMDVDLKQIGKFNSNFLTSTVIPGTSGLADAPFELDVEGHGIGWNVGGLLKIDENNSLGVFYRSLVRASLDGEFAVDNIQGLVLPTVFGGPTFRTSATTDFKFPDSLTIGYKHRFSENWEIETDFAWTNWSTFDHVDVTFGTTNSVLNGFEPVNEDFNDTFSFYFGSEHLLNESWTIMGGYFYFEKAANPANYSNVIPDGDRHGLTIGIEHSWKNLSVGATYCAVLFDEIEINNQVGAGNGASVDGSYDSFVNIAAVSVKYTI